MNLLKKLVLRRLRLLVLDDDSSSGENQAIFLAHLHQLGFVLKNPQDYNDSVLVDYVALMEELKELRGGQVDHVPLYANFPDEVPEPDEYLLKRLLGYVVNHSRWEVPAKKLGSGVEVPEWLFDLELFSADPITQRQDLHLFLKQKFKQLARRNEKAIKPTELRFVALAEAKESLAQWVRWCLTSACSFPEFYRDEILQALAANPELSLTSQEISFAEHRALYCSHLWSSAQFEQLESFVRGPTDILRLLVQLEGGDVSLAEPASFPKLKKAERRRVLSLLQRVAERPTSEAQLVKYRGLWLALERGLHSGQYRRLFPKAHSLLRKLQKGELERPFRGLELALQGSSHEDITRELAKFSDGVSLRRFCHCLSASDKPRETLSFLSGKLDKGALKDKLTLRQVLKRDATCTEAMVLTKRGSTQVIERIPSRLTPELRAEASALLNKSIQQTMKERFGSDSWSDKRVYIQPELSNWMVPMALRSASDSLTVMGRGTRVPLGERSTLRLFVYWKQHFKTTDLDLSALSFDEKVKCTGFVSWTNLKKIGLVHSGDLQSAPFGAAEFIDAELDTLVKSGHRYLALLVYHYCGEIFADLDCFCGWMMRDKPDARYKSFDIASVEQKLTVTGEAKYALPVLFDLKEREAIWLDLRVYGLAQHNQAEGSWRNIERLVRLGLQMPQWKLSLHDLARFHSLERGAELTDSLAQADISFTEDGSGDYHPGVWSKILSELL